MSDTTKLKDKEVARIMHYNLIAQYVLKDTWSQFYVNLESSLSLNLGFDVTAEDELYMLLEAMPHKKNPYRFSFTTTEDPDGAADVEETKVAITEPVNIFAEAERLAKLQEEGGSGKDLGVSTLFFMAASSHELLGSDLTKAIAKAAPYITRPCESKTATDELLATWAEQHIVEGSSRSRTPQVKKKSLAAIRNYSLQERIDLLYMICVDLDSSIHSDNPETDAFLANEKVKAFLLKAKEEIVKSILEQLPDHNTRPKEEESAASSTCGISVEGLSASTRSLPSSLATSLDGSDALEVDSPTVAAASPTSSTTTFSPLVATAVEPGFQSLVDSSGGLCDFSAPREQLLISDREIKICADLAGEAYNLERLHRQKKGKKICEAIEVIKRGSGDPQYKTAMELVTQLLPAPRMRELRSIMATSSQTARNTKLDKFKQQIAAKYDGKKDLGSVSGVDFADARPFMGSRKEDGKEDVAGLLWHDKEQNILNVGLRGSLTDPLVDSMLEDDDWKADLNSIVVDHPIFGSVHAGFAKKIESFLPALEAELDKFFLEQVSTPATAEELARLAQLRINVTGHSLGAALTQLVSVWMCKEYLTQEKMKQYGFGPDYKNAEENRLHSIALAAPRVVGSPSSKIMMEDCVGKHNMLRVNCSWDAVPNGALTPAIRDMILNFEIPGTKGKTISSEFPIVRDLIIRSTGYHDLGNLVQIPITDIVAIKERFIKSVSSLLDVYLPDALLSGIDIDKDLKSRIISQLEQAPSKEALQDAWGGIAAELKGISSQQDASIQGAIADFLGAAEAKLESSSTPTVSPSQELISARLADIFSQVTSSPEASASSGSHTESIESLLINLLSDVAAGTHNGVAKDRSGADLMHYRPDAVIPDGDSWQQYLQDGNRHMQEKYEQEVEEELGSVETEKLTAVCDLLSHTDGKSREEQVLSERLQEVAELRPRARHSDPMMATMRANPTLMFSTATMASLPQSRYGAVAISAYNGEKKSKDRASVADRADPETTYSTCYIFRKGQAYGTLYRFKLNADGSDIIIVDSSGREVDDSSADAISVKQALFNWGHKDEVSYLGPNRTSMGSGHESSHLLAASARGRLTGRAYYNRVAFHYATRLPSGVRIDLPGQTSVAFYETGHAPGGLSQVYPSEVHLSAEPRRPLPRHC